jgi:hypothetical protein
MANRRFPLERIGEVHCAMVELDLTIAAVSAAIDELPLTDRAAARQALNDTLVESGWVEAVLPRQPQTDLALAERLRSVAARLERAGHHDRAKAQRRIAAKYDAE